MKTVALVTYSKQPKLFDSDNLLIDPFKKHGSKPLSIPWDKKNVTWEKYDLVILRSTWDYHYRIPEFLDWLNKLESLKVNLWNPVNIIRWNMNKKYLLDLERMRIPIIPTLLFSKETIKEARKMIIARGWEEIVIKPAYGASSYKIGRIKSEELDPEILQLVNILGESDVLIQPFVKDVNLEGEVSFIFINKQYSHAVLKKPKKNEFRSQRKYGGKEITINPPVSFIFQAKRVLDNIPSPILYARIDGLIINGQFLLMELELIEPDLFFNKNKDAAEKFVEAAIYLNHLFPDRHIYNDI